MSEAPANASRALLGPQDSAGRRGGSSHSRVRNGRFDWITSAPLASVGVSACPWDVLDRASGPSRSPRLPGEAKSHYEAPARSSSAPIEHEEADCTNLTFVSSKATARASGWTSWLDCSSLQVQMAIDWALRAALPTTALACVSARGSE